MNYGEFGGQYVSQELKEKLNEINKVFEIAIKDKRFIEEYNYYLNQYIGRPTPLYFAKNLTDYVGGAKIYLKREDLNHTGAHKINNALGQALLAKRMGKRHIIAETGAGQHVVTYVYAYGFLQRKNCKYYKCNFISLFYYFYLNTFL